MQIDPGQSACQKTSGRNSLFTSSELLTMKQGSLYFSYVAISVFNVFSCYTAIMLNSVTIHAIRKTSSLPKTLKTLLLSLAVSDLGVGLLAQPFFVARLIVQLKQNTGNNPFYVVSSIGQTFTNILFSLASFFGVIALSADRFLAIHFFLSYKDLVTYKRVVAVMISIWLFSAFLSLISLWKRQPALLALAIINVACVIAASFLTFKVYRAARSHLNELQAMELSAQQASQNGDMVSVARLKKFAMLAVYVYIVFLVCYLPGTCFLWVISFNPEQSIPTDLFRGFVWTLVFLNSSLNPLIYCYKIGSIRLTITNMLRNVFSSHH